MIRARFVLAVFITIFLVQFFYRLDNFMVDNCLWTDRMHFMLRDFSSGNWDFPIIEDFDSMIYYRYSGHPGTVIQSLGVIILASTSLSSYHSLIAAVSLLNAAFITGIIILVRKLTVVNHAYWVAIGTIAASHSLYYYATATNAVASTLIPLILLFGYYLFRKSRPKLPLLIIFGFLIGFGLSTRAEITLFISLPLLIILAYRFGIKSLTVTASAALAAAFATNPVLWFSPLPMLHEIFRGTTGYLANVTGRTAELEGFFLYSPFTVVAFWVGPLTVIFPRRRSHLLSSRATLALIIYSGAALAVYFAAEVRSIRHFYPLVMAWDIWFAAWLIYNSRRRENLAAAFIITAHLALLSYYLSYHIPPALNPIYCIPL